MDTDDDVFTSLSPPQHPSPPANRRRLKRLKKSAAESTDEISPSFPNLADSSESQDLELEKGEVAREMKRVLEFGDELVVESTDKIYQIEDSYELQNSETSGDFDAVGEMGNGEERRETKRVLEFGDVDVECDGVGDDLGDLDAKGLEKKMNCEDGLGNLNIKGGERRGSKTILEFGDMDAEFGENNGVGKELTDLNVEGSEKKMNSEEGLRDLDIKGMEKKMENEESLSDGKEKKKNKKRRGASGGDDGESKSSLSKKRKEEKERKIYLQQLHVESQKLLRETRDATFKPIPIVHKPISSVLEKIRQRKLELMKKTLGQSSNDSFAVTKASLKEVMTDDMENVSTEKREADESAKVLQEKVAPCENNSDDSLGNNGLQEASTKLEDDNSPSLMELDEQPMQAFRAPLDDTQDLFSESQSSERKEDLSSGQNSCPLEEVFAPSLLAMNLKFDSAHPDDISSDEEDNDKENVSPGSNRAEEEAEDDPVKAFVDEEAEEEDDSDNDIRFRENDEEDYEDDEELKDLIATGYEENPMDNDMRNELHQKWLEQQDATGTDNLMQRLKYGSKLKEMTLFDDDQEDDVAADEEFYDGLAEHPPKESVARINTRKAKQLIPQMFSDKNDGYLSSDDDELEKKLTKQRLLDTVEKQSTLVSPAEDENSREVFGLIKKLNIVPDTKKKAKPSSIFDKMLTGGRANVFSKPSFVGRKGNHSVPSSHKQGTSTIRSFIFGRDDSNSRSSPSISEDSSDVTIEATPPTRNVTTKFSSSQFKFSSQITKSTSKTASGPSLFEFLKRSSIQSDAGNEDTTVGLTQTVYAAFKIPKKRIERRF